MFEMSFKGYNEFDKTFTRFCKYILGVHCKTSYFAVYSELGQVPLITNTICRSISFWLRTTTLKSDSLTFKVYLDQFSTTCDKSPWLNFVKTALMDLGFSHVWKKHGTFNIASLLKSIKEKLKERYILFWQKRIKTDEGKLRTYKLFKQNFGLESYLEIIHDRSMKRNICTFRISAHRLKNERGRYIGTNVDERLCNHCL